MLQEKNNKIKMGPQHLLNPKPVVLVGTMVDDKPNFITVSWTGITSANPPTMSIAIRNSRYSLKGIKQNMTFSVNIPNASMVDETNYCGTVSGADHNKVEECNFNIFSGSIKNAPLIQECPINIECKVYQIIDIGDHSLIIGELIETYINKECFTNSIPDIAKISPLSFCSFSPESMGYYKVGELVAKYQF